MATTIIVGRIVAFKRRCVTGLSFWELTPPSPRMHNSYPITTGRRCMSLVLSVVEGNPQNLLNNRHEPSYTLKNQLKLTQKKLCPRRMR